MSQNQASENKGVFHLFLRFMYEKFSQTSEEHLNEKVGTFDLSTRADLHYIHVH